MYAFQRSTHGRGTVAGLRKLSWAQADREGGEQDSA